MKSNHFKYIRLSYGMTILMALFIPVMTGCKKQLDVNAPAYTINEDVVFQTDASATAVLTGNLMRMSNNELWALSVLPSMSADEFSLYYTGATDNYVEYYRNTLNSASAGSPWYTFFPVIYGANAAIAGLENAPKLTPSVRKQLLGEAKFERAFCNFYLVTLFGEAPIILGTDYKVNARVSRSSVADVFTQIKKDLGEARDLLSEDFLDGAVTLTTTERVRPTKWAALALLARVALFTKDYPLAESAATEVINNSRFSLSELDKAFKANSTEAIWQLQPVRYEQNTMEGRFFIIPESGFNVNNNPGYLSADLMSDFENGDQRKIQWTDTRILSGKSYPYAAKYKEGLPYKPTTEYIMVLRLAEQYLIRAEARIYNNDITGAVADLNRLRTRATDPGALPANRLTQLSGGLAKDAALAAVLHERRVELFTEWGNRWLDLRRTGQIDAVMSAAVLRKGSTWKPFQALYPIPGGELLANPNLKQNPGY